VLTVEEYIAHFREKDGAEQSVRDHLRNTAELAAEFGKVMGLASCCYLAGLLHDLGKYSDDFQRYIRKAQQGDESAKRGSVDHSTPGGKLINELCHNSQNPAQALLAEIVGDSIISHHSGLGLQNFVNPNGEGNYEKPSDYLFRVCDKDIPDYEQLKARFFEDVCTSEELSDLIHKAEVEINEYLPPTSKVDFFFLTKFVYSCLIDADRTDTRRFADNVVGEELADNSGLLSEYFKRFEEFNADFAHDTPINRLRIEMSRQCFDFASKDTGSYTLSIPTGGGKTYSSLRFALRHSQLHGKQRIIYIVPFTTIIEQNAKDVEDALNDHENIIEHHSNIVREPVSSGNTDDAIIERKQDLLRDSWDAPIIFTTMVQFLDVVYGRGTRTVRRFHNLINSVLIFDEVQSVPINCTYMFSDALNFLAKLGKTTNVLCTATQPNFDELPIKLQLPEQHEMISNLKDVEEAFRRVEVNDKTKDGVWSIDELADFSNEIIKQQDSLLIILNTKKAVRELFQSLKERHLSGVDLYHLSTSMCAAHRKDVLKTIKDDLADKNKKTKIICVTTQLIEAGVDISFQNVIRSVAGLDSIAQAAGRCNRNGEMSSGSVYLVKLPQDVESLCHLPTIKAGQNVTNIILREGKYGNDLLKSEPIHEYYSDYFSRFKTEMRYRPKGKTFDLVALTAYPKSEWNRLNVRPHVAIHSSSKTIAEYFQVIDSPTTSVIVPYKDGKNLIAELEKDHTLSEEYELLKKAQQYTVGIFDYEREKLHGNNAIYFLPNSDKEILAAREEAYKDEYGLDSSVFVPMIY
jgi:CRISPR-associated endonuclease/helicase Cas3